MDKRQQYEDIIGNQLGTLYERMQQAIDDIPGSHLDDTNPFHQPTINMIRAIEEEWIVDKEMREELSLLDNLH